MTPSEALASHRAMLADVGEDVVVRRFTGSGAPRPHFDVTARGRVVGLQPSELVGPIVQGDRKVILMAEALGAVMPVTTQDKLVIRGKEVAIKAIDDNTRRIAGILVALEITAAG